MEQLTLTTKLKKPLTPAEWLLSSISWALGSVLGWLLLSALLSELPIVKEVWTNWLLLGAAAIAHLLIWYKSVLTTWETVAEHTEPLWLSFVSAGWTLVLILFQLSCLALLSMRNPFAKPQTPGQWLLGSVCWTLIYAGAWWLINYRLSMQWQASRSSAASLYCLSSGLASGLLWLRVMKVSQGFMQLPDLKLYKLSAAREIVIACWLFFLTLIIATGLLIAILYGCMLVGLVLLDWSIHLLN